MRIDQHHNLNNPVPLTNTTHEKTEARYLLTGGFDADKSQGKVTQRENTRVVLRSFLRCSR